MRLITTFCMLIGFVNANNSDQSVTLDLSKPVDTQIQTGSSEDYGVKHEDFTPKPGFSITKVVDGDSLIWVAGPGHGSKDKCISANKHSSNGFNSLLNLQIKTQYSTDSHCFEKQDDGKWKSIDKSVFQVRLGKMNSQTGYAEAYDMNDVKEEEKKTKEQSQN